MRIALGADHAGLALCEPIRALLKQQGAELLDFAPPAGQRVDYPDYAAKVCEAVQQKRADFGILVCGSGVGMAIAANKHQGIRAVVAGEAYTAKMSRAHNDCNIVCLGARIVGPGVAEVIVETFLNTPFEGGRHADRVAKLNQLL